MCFALQQGATSTLLTPIVGNESVVAFYGYQAPDQYSANTGYELTDRAVVLLYRDGNDNVSLVYILDEPGDGSGGSYTLSYSGAEGFQVLVYDDTLNAGGDDYSVDEANGTGTMEWGWAGCCGDGFALGYLEGEFCINFFEVNSSGLTGTTVWSSDNSSIELDGSGVFSICGVQ